MNFILTVLEARSFTSSCQRAILSLKTLGKDQFHAFLLTSGVASNPCCSLAYTYITENL